MSCPEVCPSCGDNVVEWESGKTYTCCECVKKGGKVYRVKTGITTTDKDPEGFAVTDWEEVTGNNEEGNVGGGSEPLKAGRVIDKDTTVTFGFWGKFLLGVMLTAGLLWFIYYKFVRTTPEIANRVAKMEGFSNDITKLKVQFPRSLVYLALSKNNYDLYLEQPFIKRLAENIKSGLV